MEPLGRIIEVHVRVCKTRSMRNQRNILEKMTKDIDFNVFQGLKWPGNRAYGAQIQPISEINSNNNSN